MWAELTGFTGDGYRTQTHAQIKPEGEALNSAGTLLSIASGAAWSLHRDYKLSLRLSTLLVSVFIYLYIVYTNMHIHVRDIVVALYFLHG